MAATSSSSSSSSSPACLKFFIIIFLYFFSTEGKCKFPSEWRGKYFQSGLGNVVIKDSYVTSKGHCIEEQKDYYLFANKEKNCFQCLLMIRRHTNIIQYKESFCLTPDSLKNVCAQIRVETLLHTLVRDPAMPIVCPFQDAYYFDYNDLVSGFCGQSISYAKPCVGSTRIQFHFKHCISMTSLNQKDLDMECLATWKDGSESFLYSRVASQDVKTKGNQYRCVNYQHFSNEIHMSMSADATCRGLRSPKEGQFVLELTKDSFGWPTSSCQFPHWLASVTWRDLDSKHAMRLDEKGGTLMEYFTKRSRESAMSEYRCISVLEENKQKTEITLKTFATHVCSSKHQCLRIRQRLRYVIEIQRGSPIDIDATSSCVFQDGTFQIYMAEPSDHPPLLTTCPMPGLYQSPMVATTTLFPGSRFYGGVASPLKMLSGDPLKKCRLKWNIGCTNSSVIEVEATDCYKDSVQTFTMECLALWQNSDKFYFLARDVVTSPNISSCFSFNLNNRPLTFELDSSCNRETKIMDLDLLSKKFTRTVDCRGTKSSLDENPPKTNLDSKTFPKPTAQIFIKSTADNNNNNNYKKIINRNITTMTMPINNNNIINNTSQHQQAFKIIQDKLLRSSSPSNANKTRADEKEDDEDDDDDDDADDDDGDGNDDDYDKSRDPAESVTEDTDAMVSRMRLDGTDEDDDDDDDDGDRMDDYGDLEGHQVHTFPANASTANGEQEIREWSAEESEDTDDEDYDDEFIDLTNNNNNDHHRHHNVERGRYRLLGSTNHVIGSSSSSSSSSSSASGYTFYNDKDEHEGTPVGSRVNHHTDHGQQRVAVVVPDLYDDSSNKRHRETIEIDFISGRTINRRRGNDVIRFIPSSSSSSSASFSLHQLQQRKPLSSPTIIITSSLICVLLRYFKMR